MNKLYIGVGGFARSGKDLCGKIISNYLIKHNKTPRRFALADELKIDVKDFLEEKCKVSPHTNDTSIKSKIRPFLVWYGCYQRENKLDYWINKVEDSINRNTTCDVAILTDIRFPNEVDWLHSKGGWLIHLSKYNKHSLDGGRTWNRSYQVAPNDEEKVNDPIVKLKADHCIEWEDLSCNGANTIDLDDLANNVYLKEQVMSSLKLCPGLSPIINPQ